MSSFPTLLRKIRKSIEKIAPLNLVNGNFFVTEVFSNSSNVSTEETLPLTSLPQTTIVETSKTASPNFTSQEPPATTENINLSVNPQTPLNTLATVQEHPLSPSSPFVAHIPSEGQFSPLPCFYLTEAAKHAARKTKTSKHRKTVDATIFPLKSFSFL